MGIIKQTLDQLNQLIQVRGTMPGHKGWLALDAGHDITELPGADNLQNPQGILREAETVAAQIYGTATARYLVNGSTCGNLTMIFTFLQEGDEILVERNCHKSVYNGILLRKLRPHYLWPRVDAAGLNLPQSPERIREALQAHPEVKAVLLTLPTYEGLLSDYEAIWEIVHAAGVCLLIDGAHGAALAGISGFDSFYRSCDAMVVSAHKSLGCLNQGALLLSNRPEAGNRILKYSNIFQTTSPSYLIMESIEAALEDLPRGIYETAPDFKKPFEHFRLDPVPSGMRKDPWKVLIQSSGKGAAMEAFLEARGIYPEMHDRDNVLLMLSPFNSSEEIEGIRQGLSEMDHYLTAIEPAKNQGIRSEMTLVPPLAQRLPWEVPDDWEEVPLSEAVGRVAQEQIVPYPPGIPLLIPGEVLSREMAQWLKTLETNAVKIIGLREGMIRCIREER